MAAAVWLHLASLWGVPVSTTHSIVGAITGFGILEAGVAQVHWVTLVQIVGSWFVSPIVGGLLGYTVFRLISRFILGKPKPLEAALNGVPACVFVTFGVVSLSTIYKGLSNLNLHLDAFQAVSASCAIGICWPVGVGTSTRLSDSMSSRSSRLYRRLMGYRSRPSTVVLMFMPPIADWRTS